MVKSNAQALTNLQETARKLVSAHEAIKQGIATHAEKERATLQAKRHATEQQARIAEGAAKQNAQVRAASK